MMVTPPNSSFLDRLRNAGIEPGDSEEQRLNKSLLMFATGLVSLTSMLWVTIYWWLGPLISTTPPLVFELLLVGNLLLYILTRNFEFFRVTQLALFLFGPFAMQWGMGTFIDSSGIVLWGLLAPIGAMLCFGVRESIAWFFAWVVMTIMSGVFDFYLAPPTKATMVFAVPIRTAVVFFALNFVAVATIIYLLLRYSIQEKQKIQARLQEAHRLLEAEQERSERLLLNILPSPVAERLKADEQPIADGFGDVTVMFADIVDFTRIAAHMTPNEVFSMLNQVFSAFDELAERHGLERIKTIGDAYMVAGGLNQDHPRYSEAMADMAVAMRELLEREFSEDPARLQVRIGIGTGPVVAGVVGKKKFIYDVWGDTVNIASRITAEGGPGMIQCDRTTWERLNGKFEFLAPQTHHLKGKGDVTIYRLLGRKP
jgi:class 3 adenylate cyclase